MFCGGRGQNGAQPTPECSDWLGPPMGLGLVLHIAQSIHIKHNQAAHTPSFGGIMPHAVHCAASRVLTRLFVMQVATDRCRQDSGDVCSVCEAVIERHAKLQVRAAETCWCAGAATPMRALPEAAARSLRKRVLRLAKLVKRCWCEIARLRGLASRCDAHRNRLYASAEMQHQRLHGSRSSHAAADRGRIGGPGRGNKVRIRACFA
jgi:hypothetical protein